MNVLFWFGNFGSFLCFAGVYFEREKDYEVMKLGDLNERDKLGGIGNGKILSKYIIWEINKAINKYVNNEKRLLF